MKNIYVFLVLIMTFQASAQSSVLVAAPGLPETTYQEILTERKDLLTPGQAALITYQEQEARPEIFRMADQCLIKRNCQSFQRNFEKLRAEALISPKERQLLQELWAKSGRSFDCYWQPTAACGSKKLDLGKLGLENDRSFLIFVDGLIFKAGEDIFLLPQRKYQWKIVSSRFQSKSAWATMEELQSQVSLSNPYVTGGCLASAPFQGVEKSLAENMYVAFDRTCVRRLAENTSAPVVVKSESWVERNKIWLISAVVATAGAGYYMRDKQIEFSNPFK